MDKYIVNRFVRLIKVGTDKYYVKHGILSNVSYVLSFERKNLNHIRLLDELAEKGQVSIEALSDGQYGDVSESVELLLHERILVPEDEFVTNMYFGLLDQKKGGGRKPSSQEKLLILTSSQEMKKVIEFALSGMGEDAEIRIYQGEDLALEEYFYVSMMFDRYSPDEFHKLNLAAIQANRPLQISYLDGSAAFISPVFLHNMTCCYNEMELQFESSLTHNAEYRAYKNYLREKAAGPLPYPNFARFLPIFHSLQLYLTFKVTGKIRMKDRAVIFDIENMRYDLVDLFPLPNCPACKAENKMEHDFL